MKNIPYFNRIYFSNIHLDLKPRLATIAHQKPPYTLTLDSGINIGVRLLIFGFFSRGYVLIKDSNPEKKVQNSVIWWSGICFFKGLCLLFFPNVPVATFIQGATLLESRVTVFLKWTDFNRDMLLTKVMLLLTTLWYLIQSLNFKHFGENL